MKKMIITFISIIILTTTFYFINPISDKLASVFGGTPKINLKEVNKYLQNLDDHPFRRWPRGDRFIHPALKATRTR